MYSLPIDSSINLMTKNINGYHQDLLNYIFDTYVNKIKVMCPEYENYEGTIKSIYQEKESQKVINLFSSFTNKLIDGLTKLLNSISSINLYEIEISCAQLYIGFIIDLIDNKINQYLSKKMTTLLLVKSYSRTLMSNINSYIIKDLSIEIKDEIKLYFVDICKNMLLCSINNDSSEVDFIKHKSYEPIIGESEEKEKTFDDFIDSIPNEPKDINQLI